MVQTHQDSREEGTTKHIPPQETEKIWHVSSDPQKVHLMQHSITLLLGKIALTQPEGVLVHCPFEKQMIGPLSTNQMGWRIAAECCGSHAG
jgi:hypothetical protein